MSWWNSSGWTDLASQAIKNAQSKIDKVLDIKEEDEERDKTTPPVKPKKTESPKKADSGSEFWNSWLTSSVTEDNKPQTPSTKTIDDVRPSASKEKTLPTSKEEKQSLSRKSSDEMLKSKGNKSPRAASVQSSSPQESFSGWNFNWGSESTGEMWKSENVNSKVKETKISTSRVEVVTSNETSTLESVSLEVPEDSMSSVEAVSSNVISASKSVSLEVPENSATDSVSKDVKPEILMDSDQTLTIGTCESENNREKTDQVSVTNSDNQDQTEVKSSNTVSEQLTDTSEIPDVESADEITLEEKAENIDTETHIEADQPGQDAHPLEILEPISVKLETQGQGDEDIKFDSTYTVHTEIPETDIPVVVQTFDVEESEIDQPAVLTIDTSYDLNADVNMVPVEEKENDKLDNSLNTASSSATLTDNNEDNSDTNNLEQSSESLGGSFVKCMIEEAMEDMPKPDDYNSDSHSNGEKSESSKLESEIDKSVSGHDSSDEIETTTSSDIEIISAPTPNGEYNLTDLSPLKLALQKTVQSQRGSGSHRRTDSQSSSSTYSKAGDSDQMSPGRDDRHDTDYHEEYYNDNRRLSTDEHQKLGVVSEEDNPYQTEKLLKKLAEMAEVLQARENKLVILSKENNELLESNSILRSQLEQSESAHDAKMEDVESLTEEFKQRLTDSEKRYSSLVKERDNLRKQLTSVQVELQKKISDRSQQKLLEEKDEQIKELLEEGEKLSKQQLQSNNIIKKLRVKEKENDTLITSQTSKIEEMTKELEHLRKVCDSKTDLEKKQTDAINQLNSAVQKQEKELLKYKSIEDDYQEKVRGLQAALDNSYKEIAELHKTNAAQDSKATEIAQSVEAQIREEAQMTMNKELMKAKQEKETLIMQIEDLRISMARLEKEHSRKEDLLRQEISDLQYQLQADELRNQELTQNVSSTTRPLLRQIENLQAAYKSQATSFEKVEKNLTDRLTEVQNQLAIAVDKERTASEKLMDLTAEVTSLETQNSRLKQEKSQLTVQMGLDKTKIEMLEESKQNETAHIEAIKAQTSKEIAELKRDKVFLESQIELEKNKVESERRKCSIVEEQLKILERERPKSRGTPSPISVSRQDSITSFSDQPPSTSAFLSSLPQEDLLERSLMFSSTTNKSLYEQLRHTGATALIEGLESQLKLKEGEILQLQSEITQLERTRESMAKELVNLTNHNEHLEDQLKDYPDLVKRYKELDGRYNAILQMYGEKVEETEELKLDLEDVKEMYKQQINHLLTK